MSDLLKNLADKAKNEQTPGWCAPSAMTDTRSEFEREWCLYTQNLHPSWPVSKEEFTAGFLAALRLLGDLPTERSKSLREQAERGE